MNYKFLVLFFILIGTATVCLAQTTALSVDTQIASGNVTQGTIKQAIYHFHLARNAVGTVNLTGVSFTTTGTYQNTDVTKFQLWTNTSDAIGTATQISADITSGLGTGPHSFISFYQLLTTSATRYFWITTDIAINAVTTRTLSVSALSTTNFTVDSGTTSGTASAGGAQTITAFASLSTDYFRSNTTGNWGTAGTWESSHDNSNWAVATISPTNTANNITIRNTHTVTVAVGVSTDQTTVDFGGQINVSSGVTLTIANGTDPDLIVYGTMRNNAGTITTTGTLAFGSGGLYQSNFTTTVGLIPTASWDTNSTCEVIGYTTFAVTQTGLGQSFGNFTWNCPLQTGNISANGALTTITGDMTITATNSGQLRLTTTTSPTMALGGDLIISSGTLNMSAGAGLATINLSGNFTMSGGTLTESSSGSGTINFVSTTAQVISITGTSTISQTINFAVNNGAIAEFETSTTVLGGTVGSFVANSGSTLIIKHAAGIAPTNTFTGCIQNTGTRTFNAGANYTYAGSGTQVSGTGYPNLCTGTLKINTASGISFSLSAARTLGTNGKINLASGIFAAGTQLNMGTGASITSITRSEGSMTGTLQGTNPYSVIYNGASKTTGDELSGGGLGNITINLSNSSNTLTLDRSVTVDNPEVLTFTQGSLTLSDFNLIMNGTYTGTNLFIYSGSGALSGGTIGNNANVLINTTAPFALPSTLNSLDIAPGIGNSVTLPSDVTTTILTFTNGSLTFNGYTLTLAGQDFAITGSNSISGLNVSLDPTTVHTNSGYSSIAHTWQTNGTFSGTVNIIFSYPNTYTSPTMKVYNRDHIIGESSWNYLSTLSSVNHTTYYSVTLAGVTTLNGSKKGDLDWTLSETDQDLPVELSSFTVSVSQQAYVTLEWVTQSETNASGYNIYRNNMDDLSSAVQVNANLIPATNTSAMHTYYFRDVIVTNDDAYYYWLQDVSYNGTMTFHGPVMVILGNNGQTTPPPNIPLVTSVQGVFPNPFTPSTIITYGVAKKSMVSIHIYNAKGQLVRTLLSEVKDAENYRAVWDGKDGSGHNCASGIYFIELASNHMKSTVKATLMK